MTDNLLSTGALQPTNEWYAVAKIAGLKLVQAYIGGRPARTAVNGGGFSLGRYPKRPTTEDNFSN